MKKLAVSLIIILSLAGCGHRSSLRDQVLHTPNGAAHVKECEDIARTITPAEAKAEGWTLDECYKAFL